MKGCREKQDRFWPQEGEIMRKRIVPFAMALLLLGVTGCSSSDSSATETTSVGVVELPAGAAEALANYTDAVLAADGDAMLDYVTDNFTFLSYGTDVQEREFRADYVTKNYGNFEVEVIGDQTVVGGDETYIVSIPERATTPVVAEGISVVRLVESDGTWLVDVHRFVGE